MSDLTYHDPCVFVRAGMGDMQEAIQKMAQMMGGGGLGGLGDEDDGLAGLTGGGDGDDLKARVREQMAAMMNKRRGGMAVDEDEF